MADRFLCIHGHFYQPPRENPWLEAIELQDSAYPYHDWNVAVNAECYAPNAASRIIDADGRIGEIVNNYAKISFNFGPTLLHWMQDKAPQVHQAIVDADRLSQSSFAGHSSALAQPFNHMIMPLANHVDRVTQVRWGIRDYEHRFGHSPEGMWLPETAVDLETLDILAEEGIRFTVLAPHQAHRVRHLGARAWEDMSGARIDPSMPYRVNLVSGRAIDLFFYDGPVSRGVAFEGLLANGEAFAERLLGSYTEGQNRGALIHIATDGETYGHHHRYGDMALAYAVRHIENENLARITNYGEYLELHPPSHEVEIYENTSWSCEHGIERWRSDCGCNAGGQAGWNQAWRRPVRQALDWLRDELAPRYEKKGGALLASPWAARDDYVSVLLDRSPETTDAFLASHASHPLDSHARSTTIKLLELQRNALLMFTSCGWFFSELTGIETVQCLRYAGRALQLAEEIFDVDLERGFLDILAEAKSNLPDHRDGAKVYQQRVRPAMVDLQRVGAHYAISSLFEPYEERTRIYCYDIEREDYHTVESGRSKVVVGRARVTSEITEESASLSFGVLSFGDHNVAGGDRPFLDGRAHHTMSDEILEAFSAGDLPQVIRHLDRHFGASTYSLKSLFRDEQRRILDSILESVIDDAEAVNRQIYEHNSPLMRYLSDFAYPKPAALLAAAELVLNADLRRMVENEDLDHDRTKALLSDAARLGIRLDSTALQFAFKATLGRLAQRVQEDVGNIDGLNRLEAAVELSQSLPFTVDLWEVQNIYWTMLHTVYPEAQQRALGNKTARDWLQPWIALGDRLNVRIPT